MVSSRAPSIIGYLSAGIYLILTLVYLLYPTISSKVVITGWIAFIAMTLGALLGSKSRAEEERHALNLVWGYGLSSGAMITSAAIFILPPALSQHMQAGGLGVAAGIIAGFVGHTAGHRTSHTTIQFDYTTASLTAHTVTAGIIIGVVYATLPELGLLLGIAIVSHKAPAGYAASRRLTRIDRSPAALLTPAAGLGIAAVTTNILTPTTTPMFNSLLFGFAAGIFLHIAMDFLPRCELGSEVYEVATTSQDSHDLLDKLRLHAVISTALGGTAVVIAWLLV